VARVEYVDLLKVRLRYLGNERYFHKHRAFEWEREFRLLISLMEADEFTGQAPPGGIEVDVDLNALVERIVIGPDLSKEDMDLVVVQAGKAGLAERICKSSLLGEPRFF
jgi:hypothetical protein